MSIKEQIEYYRRQVHLKGVMKAAFAQHKGKLEETGTLPEVILGASFQDVVEGYENEIRNLEEQIVVYLFKIIELKEKIPVDKIS